MFAALRIATVIGIIFYFSPVRRAGELPMGGGAPSGPGGQELWTAEAAWHRLPEAAKRTILDAMLALGVGSLGSSEAPASAPARDTLQPEDLQPAWRGDAAPVPPSDKARGSRGATVR